MRGIAISPSIFSSPHWHSLRCQGWWCGPAWYDLPNYSSGVRSTCDRALVSVHPFVYAAADQINWLHLPTVGKNIRKALFVHSVCANFGLNTHSVCTNFVKRWLPFNRGRLEILSHLIMKPAVCSTELNTCGHCNMGIRHFLKMALKTTFEAFGSDCWAERNVSLLPSLPICLDSKLDSNQNMN